MGYRYRPSPENVRIEHLAVPTYHRGMDSPREHRRRGIVASVVMAIVLGATAVGWPVPSAQAASAYQLELYRRGDFVSQTNLVQCVGASMQMMINMMAAQDDRSAGTQHELWLLARTFRGRNAPPRPANRPARGASVHGWSKGLNVLGYGPYRVVGFATIEEAARAAARSIALTGRPVGVLVWAGRHAWVMSGFTATADPLVTDDFEVTAAQVLDPLYPRHSTTWGRSPEPGARVSLETLGHYFVPRRKSTYSGTLAGQWVLVLPDIWQPGVRLGAFAA
jgi:hypothetical protein